MKFRIKKFWGVLSVVIGLAILYRDSFNSKFFQDDFLLLKLSQTTNPFIPIQEFPYRPISIHFFYGPLSSLFGQNPLSYHLFLFFLLILGVFFALKLAQELINPNSGSLLGIIIYSFNISLFALFYWTATAYFTYAIFFAFLGLYFHQKNKPYGKVISLISFSLGIFSNEIMFVYPVLVFLVDWYRKKINLKGIAPFFLIDAVIFVSRVFLISLPKDSDYHLVINLQVFNTLRWYGLRILNLPEGRAAFDRSILLSVSIELFAVAIIIFNTLKNKTFPYRLFIFALLWFFVGALPFFFLPGHMSAYYLSLSLFGPAIFLGSLFDRNKAVCLIFILSYLYLSFQGLENLKLSHWIILKPQQ